MWLLNVKGVNIAKVAKTVQRTFVSGSIGLHKAAASSFDKPVDSPIVVDFSPALNFSSILETNRRKKTWKFNESMSAEQFVISVQSLRKQK